MSREVISNDMNLTPARLTRHQVSEKGDERLTGMPLSRATNHCSGLGIQRGVQREGAVTMVLKPMSLCASGRQRQHRIQPVQGLDARLFIHAEDDRMLRRLYIQSNNAAAFCSKVRIVGPSCSARSAEAESRPASRHGPHHVMNAKLLGQLPRAPVRRPVERCAAGPGQDFGLHFSGFVFHGPTG